MGRKKKKSWKDGEILHPNQKKLENLLMLQVHLPVVQLACISKKQSEWFNSAVKKFHKSVEKQLKTKLKLGEISMQYK